MQMLLVADGGRARFYLLNDDFEDLSEELDLVHPEARLRAADVYEGEAGAMAPHTDRRDVEDVHFARQVAHTLQERLSTYDGLHIAAAPRFLGHLRKQLGKSVQRKLVSTLAKDLTNATPHELQKWARENR